MAPTKQVVKPIPNHTADLETLPIAYDDTTDVNWSAAQASNAKHPEANWKRPVTDHELDDQLPLKKFKAISAEKQKLYDEYTVRSVSSRMWPASIAAHDWMDEKLKEWQAKNKKHQHDMPFLNEWFLDARVECIHAGFITKEHSRDVVRSYIKSYLKK